MNAKGKLLLTTALCLFGSSQHVSSATTDVADDDCCCEQNKTKREERMDNKLQRTQDKVSKTAEEKKDEAKETLSAAAEKIKQKGRDVKEAVEKGAQDVAEKVKNTTSDLKVGDDAPSFSLKDECGRVRTLEEFKGKRIVLYFYPKDDTPGCTKQACSLRDNYKIFKDNNIIVLGVNYGSIKSHRQFKEKLNLPFILLSDSKRAVAKTYGARSAWIFVPQRKTYLIDEQAKIKAIMEDVDPATHTQLVLEAFGVLPVEG